MSNYLNVNILLSELVDYCKINQVSLPKVVVIKTYENGKFMVVFHNHKFVIEGGEVKGKVLKATIFGTGF